MKVMPAHAPAANVSLGASAAAKAIGARGPTFCPGGSCASACFALIAAAQLLACGDADVVVAGASDSIVEPWPIASFANMRALARHADPERASRPLDRDRNGFVIAEGAAAFVVERLAAARERGARVYAVLAGYGMSGDAGDVMAASAEGIAHACRIALAKADVRPVAIEHVNLHAAGTRQGDLAEARALHDVLGPRAAEVPVTAPKSLIGHAMGASAGLEIVLALKTLETGLVPPTINLDTIDPAIALNASAAPVRHRVDTILKTSFGVGGLNAVLVFRRPGDTAGSGEIA